MQHNSYRRWITLAIISFSGGVSFDLAYLRYIYQIPMAKFKAPPELPRKQ